MKIVEILWRDSTSYGNAWMSDCADECAICQSVGYLVKDEKDKVVLVQSIQADDTMNRFVIPRGCIKKMKILK